MDWYYWLSKTNLDPTLVYEYGTTFARNQLQQEDLSYFNHEFLQSIGISIAKHRLEILKLTKKEVNEIIRPNGFSKFASAIKYKTKKIFLSTKLGFFHKINYSGKFHKNHPPNNRSIVQSGPLDRRRVLEKFNNYRSVSVSGPLDGKMQEKLTYPNWSPMVTRPINGRTKERLGYFCKSPTMSGAIDRWGLSPQVNYYRSEKVVEDDDEYGVQSLWSMMFQDMKPT